MSKSKMKKQEEWEAPKEIWLQAGEGQNDEDTTWCQDKIYDSDIKYVRADLVYSNLK